jgi:hypothetical protein
MEEVEATINNGVLNALSDAFTDVLDADGRASILSVAGYGPLVAGKLPAGETPTSVLAAVVDAMSCLLVSSDSVVHEIGRKFAHYLDPCGTSFPDFVGCLNAQLRRTRFECAKMSHKGYNIAVIGEDGGKLPEFYRGLLHGGLQKGARGRVSSRLGNAAKGQIQVILEETD